MGLVDVCSFQVKCRGDELDVTSCLEEEVCETQEYASVVCYGFLLTTGQCSVPQIFIFYTKILSIILHDRYIFHNFFLF